MTSNGWSPLGFTIGPTPNEPRALIALPVYSGLMTEFVSTLLASLSHLNATGISVRIEFLNGDSLIPRARNNLAHQWYHHSQIPFFVQLDTDLILDPEGIKRLLSHPPEYAVIGGCYPKKKPGPAEWVVNPIPGINVREDGLQEVWEMGTGLLRIHRSVYAAVKASYPQLTYICDGAQDERLDLFPVGTFPDPLNKRNRYLSEDWYLCQLARALGFKVWADTKCAARHLGQVAYPWPPEQQLQPPAAANSDQNSVISGQPGAVPPPAPVIENRESKIENPNTCPPSDLSPQASATAATPPTSSASTPPLPSLAPPVGIPVAQFSAPSASRKKKSSGRGRTRKKARMSRGLRSSRKQT